MKKMDRPESKRVTRTGTAAAVAVVLLSLHVGNASAQVAFTPSTTTLQLPARLHVGSTPVGGTLWTSSVSQSRKVDPHATAAFVTSLTEPTLVNGYSDVYMTSIAGIGIRWHNTLFGNNFSSGVQLPPQTGQSPGAGGLAATLPMQKVWFELIRTADNVVPGPLQVTGQQRVSFNCGAASDCRWHVAVGGTTNLTVGTCSMPASIPVNLGDHRASAFNTPGTTSPWVDFNIALRSCPAGYQGLIYRLTPQTGVRDPARSVLGVAQGGATGVGVQVWDGWHNIAARLVVGQQLFNLAPGTTTVDLPMRARIMQMDPQVSAGSVAASMELRIEYR